MGHSSIRIKVRRRKVANLAAQSRHFTVRNNTIKTAANIPEKANWPEQKHPQHKPMMKAHMEWIYNKETHITEKVHVPSTFPTKKYDDIQKSLWKNLPQAAKWEAYAQDKLKKWEKKHPKPCPDDDLFKDEMIPAWEAEKEQALIHFRDFVVSMFDKLPLSGRFKMNEKTATYQEKQIAELKDINGEGHKVNELKGDSKLLKKAQEITDKTHAKHANLVCANLCQKKPFLLRL